METSIKLDDSTVLGRLIRLVGPFGFIAIDQNRVNIEDLVASELPGAIVRCDGNPNDCINVVIPGAIETLGCVGGWISDEG